eukprot:scaffold137_cov192-Alexandrium_tamarense.AAC.9
MTPFPLSLNRDRYESKTKTLAQCHHDNDVISAAAGGSSSKNGKEVALLLPEHYPLPSTN